MKTFKELADEFITKNCAYGGITTAGAVRLFGEYLDQRYASALLPADAQPGESAATEPAPTVPAADNGGDVPLFIACDCDVGDECPQGRTGFKKRCIIRINLLAH